jgi:hypothetical protein
MSTILKTPVGRLSFPSLFKPKRDDKKPQDQWKYEATLIFPSGTDLSEIEKEIDRAATAEWGDKKPLMLKKMKSFPIKSNEKATDMEGNVRGGYEDQDGFHVQFKSNSRPKVVGREKDPQTGQLLELTPEEIFAGCYVRASYTTFASIHDEGGPFVYMALQNLQLIKEGEPFAGTRSKAEDDFADEMDPAVLAALA